MNKKPRWKDREGNLYTDKEVRTINTLSQHVVVTKVGEKVVIPLTKKFSK
jgi:hypothetical protein